MAVDTHDVRNQPPPLAGHDVFLGDDALVEAVDRHGAGAAADRLSELGRLAGTRDGTLLGASWRTSTSPACARTTATATGSTRSSSTRPGTN